MQPYNEEQIKQVLQGMADAEPRAEFVQALEEKLVQESRRLRNKQSRSRKLTWAAAVAASVVLAGFLLSSGGQQVMRNAIHYMQHKPTPPQQNQQTLPQWPTDKGPSIAYVAFEPNLTGGTRLYFSDPQTMQVKASLLLSNDESCTMITQDKQGRIWCPMRDYRNQNSGAILIVNPKTQKVTRVPFPYMALEVFLTDTDAYVLCTNGVMLRVDQNLQVHPWMSNLPSIYLPTDFDGTYFNFYKLNGDYLKQPGVRQSVVRYKTGATQSSDNGQEYVLTDQYLHENMMFFSKAGLVYLNLKGLPGVFVEYDRNLNKVREMKFDQVQQDSKQQLTLEDDPSFTAGGKTYAVIHLPDLGGVVGNTQFAIVDRQTGEVVKKFTTPFPTTDHGMYVLGNKLYVNDVYFKQVEVLNTNGDMERVVQTKQNFQMKSNYLEVTN